MKNNNDRLDSIYQKARERRVANKVVKSHRKSILTVCTSFALVLALGLGIGGQSLGLFSNPNIDKEEQNIIKNDNNLNNDSNTNENSGNTDVVDGNKVETVRFQTKLLTAEKTASDKTNRASILANETYNKAMIDFSTELFRESYSGNNTLVSPMSVYMVLGMVVNGASGETQRQMLEVLGLTLAEANEYCNALYSFLVEDGVKTYLKATDYNENTIYYSQDTFCGNFEYVGKLSQAEFNNNTYYVQENTMKIANSIWNNHIEGYEAKEQFLNVCSQTYGAEIYEANFDETTRGEINAWVSKNTNGLIKNALERIEPSSLMYLINTLFFQDSWTETFKGAVIENQDFTNIEGQTEKVDYLYRTLYSYYQTSTAKAFSHELKSGCSFIGILPNEGVSLNDYIASFSTTEFENLMSNEISGDIVTNLEVHTTLPKFSYSSNVELENVLSNMGMTDAFKSGIADFSNMSNQSQYLDGITHKTKIELDENGIKAAAVTIAHTDGTCPEPVIVSIDLNRPFMYVVFDNNTNTPLFMGAITDFQSMK